MMSKAVCSRTPSPKIQANKTLDHHACRICEGNGGWAFEAHRNCLALVSGRCVAAICRITSFAYRPSQEEVDNRTRRIIYESAEAYVAALPHEIRFLIAQYVTELSATALTLAALPSEETGAKLFRVNLRGPIMCKFTKFQGRGYVLSLSNSWSNASCLVYSPAAREGVKYIFTEEDYLGVSRVVFGTKSMGMTTQAPGRWWRSLIISKDTTIEAESDVSFLHTCFPPLTPSRVSKFESSGIPRR